MTIINKNQRQENSRQEQSIFELNDELNLSRKKIASLTREVSELETTESDLRTRSIELENQVGILENKNSELDRTVKFCQHFLEEAEKREELFEGKYNENQEKIMNQTERNGDLQRQLKEMGIRANSLGLELKETEKTVNLLLNYSAQGNL